MILTIICIFAYVLITVTVAHFKWIISRSDDAEKSTWSDHILFAIFFPVTTYSHSKEKDVLRKEKSFLEYAEIHCHGILKALPFSVCQYNKKNFYILFHILVFPFCIVWMLSIGILVIVFYILMAALFILGAIASGGSI